jgi:outer membrane protein
MARRRDSIEGGPTFDWDFDVIAFSVAYFGDLSRASRGRSLRASIYKPLLKDDSWDVGALLQFDAMNSRLANYYFGVRAAEANAARPEYQPGKQVNTSVGLSGTYKLDKQHALMFGAIVTRLAVASPIVEKRNAPTFYFGYGWNL